jgi:hypothetical protein
MTEANLRLVSENAKLRAALTVERERHGDEMTSVQLQLNKQLAAERSKAELAEYQWKEVSKKVQTLVDALTIIANEYSPSDVIYAKGIAADALAKVK